MRNLQRLFLVCSLLIVAVSSGLAQGQSKNPKMRRVSPPTFDSKSFDGIFYADVKSQLNGELPNSSTQSSDIATKSDPAADGVDAEMTDSVWKKRIDTATIEDLVKSAKRRLDPAVSSPAKFASGGYQVARREFTMLTALFGIIEQYPGDVRWKHSAARAKFDFARVASNSKVGSIAAFNEAKSKTQVFGDLLNGVRLDDLKDDPLDWNAALDRGATMVVLDWSLRDNMNVAIASESAFANEKDGIVKYAQLIAALGEIISQKDMPDADTEEYVEMSGQMVQACDELIVATGKSDFAAVREAISKLDKSCNNCHEAYR